MNTTLKRALAITSAAAVIAAGLVAGMAGAASAHTPTISASCSGVKLKATDYDRNKANVWEVKIGDAVESGTFGASLDKLIPVPQEAATTSWTATIKAHDGGYAQTKSGTVGPCGKTTVQLPTLGATPATCDAPGGLAPDFTAWPAAQNANGYEGDGFRVYVSPAYTGPGTYVATLQKVGAGFDPRYPNGTTIVGETTQTIIVDPIKADSECMEDKPQPKITKGEWSHGTYVCGDETVAIQRVVTTTQWKPLGRGWELDTTTTVETIEYGTREPNAEEIEACTPDPLPAAATASFTAGSCLDGGYTGNTITAAYENATLAVTKDGEPYTGPLTGLGTGEFVLTFTPNEGYTLEQTVFPFSSVVPTEGCVDPCELTESSCDPDGPDECDPTTEDGKCVEAWVPPAKMATTGIEEDFLKGGVALFVLLMGAGGGLIWREARRRGALSL